MPAQEDIESVPASSPRSRGRWRTWRPSSPLSEGAQIPSKSKADIQKERIDLAARELAEGSERLQAAANALRQSI